MNSDLVLFEKNEYGIATLTLNRPEKFNAFTKAMIHRWHELLVSAADDPEIKVILLTGAGKAFCAGGDAGAMKERAGNESLEQKDFLWRHVHRIARTMEELDKPVIAVINGAARGAGLDMALMCDIRFAAESATVAESYINMGLIAGDGGSYYLPRIIGTDHALELFWTGRALTARDAHEMGMITHVHPDNLVMEKAHELARKIAAQPTDAVQFYKRAVRQSRDMSLVAHLDMVSSHMAVLRGTPAHRERVAAFLERRKGGE